MRIKELAKIANEYFIFYSVNKILAAISSILLVRYLSVNEYGFFSFILLVFGFIVTFSDLGIAESLAFFRYRAIQKNSKWHNYFYAIIKLRNKLFLISFILSITYIFLNLKKLEDDFTIIIINILLMGAGAWFLTYSNLMSYSFKLQKKFRNSYLIEFSNEFVKILIVLGLIFFGFITFVPAIFSIFMGSFISALLSFYFYKKLDNPNKNFHFIRKSSYVILKQNLPVLPGIIHFALQGPLLAWLALSYGSIRNVAEISALGRIGILFTALSGFIGSVFIPSLIQVKEKTLLRRIFLKGAFITFMLGVLMTIITFIMKDKILAIIGSNYSSLTSELLVVVITAIFWVWNGYLYSFNRAKGWVKNQHYSLILLIIAQLGMIKIFDLSITINLLIFSAITAFILIIFQIFIAWKGFLTER